MRNLQSTQAGLGWGQLTVRYPGRIGILHSGTELVRQSFGGGESELLGLVGSCYSFTM